MLLQRGTVRHYKSTHATILVCTHAFSWVRSGAGQRSKASSIANAEKFIDLSNLPDFVRLT